MTESNPADFLSAFSLTDTDRKAMAEVWLQIAPEIDGVLGRFYSFAMGREDMRGFFKTEASRRHAESAQKTHWELLFSGRFDKAYFASAERVGRIHFKIDLPFLMYIGGYSRAAREIVQIAIAKTHRTFGAKGKAEHVASTIVLAVFMDIQAVIDGYFRARNEDRDHAVHMLFDGIARMSAGELEYRVPNAPDRPFPKRFDDMRLALNGFGDLLCNVFDIVGESADAVRETASQLTGSAEQLSGRSQSQAAALEQSAAAVTELVQSVGSSKALFASVSSSTEDNHRAAREGFAVISEASDAMENIQKSAAEIGKITDLIDSISFQTNLLALNASVEAARAGDSGRGFAVVATEVRTLAQKSAEAAGEIKALISRSLSHVRQGADLVKKSGKSLEAILDSAEGVARGVTEVGRVNAEQAMALNEIGATIQDLDRTTQQNAHAASELSDASGVMNGNAARLANPMDIFRDAARGAGETAFARAS